MNETGHSRPSIGGGTTERHRDVSRGQTPPFMGAAYG